MKENRKPILVTGLYRSATTWTGIIICYSGRYGNIYEPFNPDVSSLLPDIKFPFLYVCKENEDRYIESLDKVMNFDYDLNSLIKDSKNIELFKRNLQVYLEFIYFRRKKNIPLIKDPIAVFSADWLAEKFDMDVVVMNRHPLGFISSLLKSNFGFDFNHLLRQALLIDDYLKDYAERIIEMKDQLNKEGKNRETIIKYGVLMWEIINSVILKYKKKHKNWFFYRLEDIQTDTRGIINGLYSDLNIKIEPSIDKKINYRLTKKKSKNKLKSWENDFSKEEMLEVKRFCQDKAEVFYGNSDW